MPRARFQPTAEQRKYVEGMASVGIPEADIASVLKISAPTLRKYFRDELDTAHVKANAKVGANLFRMATGNGPSSCTAAIFWMKTRARWKETQVIEHDLSDDRDDELTSRLLPELAGPGKGKAPPETDGGTAPPASV